ncbi:MAG: hypothetical protein DMF63_05090 [Acidobacteria bacterium]|nr:MAG: hypothetical protein DMF63_05090 [Acidobacteriota bacterium]
MCRKVPSIIADGGYFVQKTRTTRDSNKQILELGFEVFPFGFSIRRDGDPGLFAEANRSRPF